MPSKRKREERIKQLISREYRLYQEEERFASLPRTLYEKACRFAERLGIEPDKKSRTKIEETIEFAHLKVTPRGTTSLTVLFLLVTMIPTMILMALPVLRLPGLPLGYGLMTLLLVIFFTFYIHTYPKRLRRRYESETGSEIVMLILYIAMYMRNVPNLEGAVRFAADNLGGSMGYEMKKLLWDVEIGNYLTMQEALTSFTAKWSKNRPFIESVELLITSLKQVGEKRIVLLDEAVDIVLEGSREQAKHFNQDLKLPVMVVHALGIVLPVMGLVLFPILAAFLNVSSTILFVGYDIILPLILYFVISNILETRPATFSKIDITDNPDVPPPGRFAMGRKFYKAWHVGLLVGILIVGLGIFLLVNEIFSAGENFEGIVPALVITMGISFGFGSYFLLLSRQRLAIRRKTREIETEFAEALFQLGNQISGGVPVELSLEHLMERIKNLKIKDLFAKALKNMKLLGFTFQQAFFDKEYGAIRFYPSKLIKSIMRTVVESAKKGVKTASIAMLSVSRYLKGLHDTQEDVKEELNDTLSSLKFQSYFLSPMISGIVATLAIIIIKILKQIGEQVSGLGNVSVPFLTSLGNVRITPFEFILIVSIYLIETAFILAMFINSIESGEDSIGRQSITGTSLIIGFVVFTVCMIGTLVMFEPLIVNTIAR